MPIGRLAMSWSLAALASCAAATPAWEPYRGMPPLEVLFPHEGMEWSGCPVTFEGGGSARFFQGLGKRLVRGVWERGSSSGSDEYPTQYVPTTLLAPSPDSLLVAGKRDDGRTVIELWTFDASVLPPRRIARTLYDEAREGRDMVALLLRVPGSGRSCLVQFWDSRDLYEMTLDSPASLRLLASPTPKPGALTVPPLRRSFDQVWSADHVSRGFVYQLGTESPEPSLILVDADRDGRLDRYVLVSSAEWGESGWGDGTAYRHDER
jgi:hypothetical protein